MAAIQRIRPAITPGQTSWATARFPHERCVVLRRATSLLIVSNIPGNMIQIHERHAWKFMDYLTNAYGPVVKLTGFLNVSYLPNGALLTLRSFAGTCVVGLRPQSFASCCTQRSRRVRGSRIHDHVRTCCTFGIWYSHLLAGAVLSHLVQAFSPPPVYNHSAPNLLTLPTAIFIGDHHRRQRKLLNPVFSIAHLRHLTPIFFEVMHRVSVVGS